ncbi:uncharacterized protein C2845_PM05G07340 [Panicum miliaceum]|uniref:Uncharacterized protein n=1 Tax=Panicum miliaceum TaxID=4540 RepID=A0A3L6T2U2_PANMI|nr:uncharacterized protein C2845_PM05G07340 [Panicum miliaceum]
MASAEEGRHLACLPVRQGSGRRVWERILVRQAQFRPWRPSCRPEVNPMANGVAVAASEKLERSDGIRASGLHPREELLHAKCHLQCQARREQQQQQDCFKRTTGAKNGFRRCANVPGAHFAAFLRLITIAANDDDEQERKEADLMVLSSIKKLEEEAARTRQEVSQLKKGWPRWSCPWRR